MLVISAGDTEGWPLGFLKAGDGAFIGAYRSTSDQAANDFAKAFCTYFLSDMVIGQAVLAARQEVKKKHLDDPTPPGWPIQYTPTHWPSG